MSLTTKVLVALVAGLAGGLALSRVDATIAVPIVSVIEPVGTVFVNAIRMTVIPLVVASLIVGIATADGGTVVAKIGGRGLVVFLIILIIAGAAGALISTPILLGVSLDPAATTHLRETAAAAGGQLLASGSVQTPSQWLVSLIPSNPVRAATDGAMLPLILFALLLGLALVSVPVPSRERFVAVLRGLADSMLVIVRWLLVVAPIGVFALALPLVARLGVAAIGALAVYVVLVSLISLALLLVIYPMASWGSGISLRTFMRAAAPAQAVAFSSRSSIAALPALIETSRDRLRLPDQVTGFFLPLASAVFRPGAALGLPTGAVFIARLYGVHLSAAQIVTVVATSIVTSFSIPGIPGGSIIAMAPVLASVGLPIEGVGILLGVDTIPDLFRTTTNVTGQLAAAAIVSRQRTDSATG